MDRSSILLMILALLGPLLASSPNLTSAFLNVLKPVPVAAAVAAPVTVTPPVPARTVAKLELPKKIAQGDSGQPRRGGHIPVPDRRETDWRREVKTLGELD